MTESILIALIGAGAAFLGGFLGSAMTILFARRTAFNTALGQKWAERRIEVIEELTKLMKQTADNMDEALGADMTGTDRDASLIFTDLEDIIPVASLYLSKRVIDALAPYRQWLGDRHNNLPRPETNIPGNTSYHALQKLLAEAIEGQHSRS